MRLGITMFRIDSCGESEEISTKRAELQQEKLRSSLTRTKRAEISELSFNYSTTGDLYDAASSAESLVPQISTIHTVQTFIANIVSSWTDRAVKCNGDIGESSAIDNE